MEVQWNSEALKKMLAEVFRVVGLESDLEVKSTCCSSEYPGLTPGPHMMTHSHL